MTTSVRCCAVSLAALLLAVSSSTTGTQAQLHQEDPVWRLGDMFAGVGWVDYLRGEYWVYNSAGEPKLFNGAPQKLVDTWDEKWRGGVAGVATGCRVAPGGDLYVTSFHGLTVSRFDAAPPHSRSLMNTIDYTATVRDPHDNRPWSAFAIESIAFDAAGQYYVGGQGPLPKRRTDEVFQGPGFVFMFGRDNALKRVFEVPSGKKGADQIDVGSDSNPGPDNEHYPTIYYTSEDTIIRVFRPWRNDASRYGAIQVTDLGRPIAGTLYAVRALPPLGDLGADDPLTAEDERKLPGGFLVVGSTDVLRLDATGRILRRYRHPQGTAVVGAFFALSIAPDGQSFWASTYSLDAAYPEGNAPAYLLKFHIPTGRLDAVVQVPAGAVWGLCTVGEYAAATNTCYVTDANGRGVDADNDGRPDITPCRIPRHCTPGDLHQDCTASGGAAANAPARRAFGSITRP